MSVAGPLFAAGLAFFFAGLFQVAARPRPLNGLPLVALGAAMMGAAYELMSKGV